MKKKELSPELRRYAATIEKAPSSKKVTVYTFDTKAEALTALPKKLKTWAYKVVVQARGDNGRFTKGWALICCK